MKKAHEISDLISYPEESPHSQRLGRSLFFRDGTKRPLEGEVGLLLHGDRNVTKDEQLTGHRMLEHMV